MTDHADFVESAPPQKPVATSKEQESKSVEVAPTEPTPVHDEATEPAVVLPAVDLPAPQPAVAIVAPGEEEDDDVDSAFGDAGSIHSSTASLTDSIRKYRKENGRTYHAYKDGEYLYPNDALEQDRLDFQHQQYLLTFSGKLFTAPIPKEQTLHRVLDVGTGTGIWAIDFADAHPESKVLGVDLSPIQPNFTSPNLYFEVDDIEESWLYNEKFDFIYYRNMIGSLNNVERFCNQAFAFSQPGGWLEMADVTLPPLLNDGEWPKDSAHFMWQALMTEGFSKFGRDGLAPRLYKDQMIKAGFVNVVETKYYWPTSTWPKDKKLKELGQWQHEILITGIEAMSLAIFTRILGWSELEVQVLLAGVRNELRDTRIHSYYEVFVVHGQRPG